MRLDGHIHVMDPAAAPEATFPQRLSAAGCAGGLVISLPPPGYNHLAQGFGERLENLCSWCAAGSSRYGFLWIDPLDPEVCMQIDAAPAAGVRGFKVICDRFYPYDPRAMAVFRRIAATGYPVLLHSGVLGDGKFSSHYNRPIGFECLIENPKLRFALAHFGWPWCDEYLALLLMFQSKEASDPDAPKMFLDNTAGTPHIYRKEALQRLDGVCRIRERMFFGSDLLAGDYRAKRAAELMARDDDIYRELGWDNTAIDHVYHRNLMAFIEGEK
ncbi:hypothetical protein SDC9_113816 [bioreactor metagenome]|uniref:Amidohydrolase-related domain-containing protein n=1 Tax=bioreactor metagenome TaxID=1076179 RepID=A0A645BUJ1_9ZZZZ